MSSARSRSLLTAIVVAPVATGCFLSGDYKLRQETVTVPGPETSDEATSTEEALPSEVTPTSPAVPPPSTTTTTSHSDATSEADERTTAPPLTSSEARSVADSTAAWAPATSTEDTMPPNSDGDSTSAQATSEQATSEQDTNGWQASNNWWDSSGGRCWQGNCADGCGEGEVRGPEGRCYWFGTTAVTWPQAKAACLTHGEYWVPIAIHNEEEDDFISSQIDHSKHTWLGAQYSMGAWRWLDDSSVFWNGNGANGAVADVFNKWGTDEPSGSPGETCSRIQSYNSDMRWGDGECVGTKLPACQSPPPGAN
jgi:hypothetical protein